MKNKINKERLLPKTGETQRLLIKDAVMEECEKLQLVNEASDYIEKWVGWKTPSNYMFTTLTEGNLPPGGKKECFQVKSIYHKQTEEIIGVMEIYNGYPSKEVLAIGWIFILPSYQKDGYAKEALNLIFEEAKKVNYKKVGLGVHLKNWPAIRFWHKLGFNTIVKIIGDEVHSESTFASIILEKNL